MPDLSRRDTLQAAGTITLGGLALSSIVQPVTATDSGDAELTAVGTIPDAAEIEVTISEYDIEGSSSPINTATTVLTETNDPSSLSNLDAERDYYYAFDGEIRSDNGSPELESIVFEVPRGPDDFQTIDYTDTLEWEAKPDDVTIEYDEWYLREYQPLLDLTPDTRDRFNGLYGYVARSEDHDTDVLCYWSYTNRHSDAEDERIETGSQLGDHQPIYVFVESATGAIDKIVYSAYHWYTQTITPSDETLAADRREDPSHAVFEVTEPWDHYRFTPSGNGEFVELKPWPEIRETWRQNSFYDSIEPELVENPWEIDSVDYWWSDSFTTLFDRLWATIGQTLGWYGSDEADY